jgi:hypothetical protein
MERQSRQLFLRSIILSKAPIFSTQLRACRILADRAETPRLGALSGARSEREGISTAFASIGRLMRPEGVPNARMRADERTALSHNGGGHRFDLRF